jgi:glycosyltransferase involved in cell wall biosynthesis
MGLLRLLRFVKRWQPDVIQTSLWHADVLGKIVGLFMRIPVVHRYASTDDDKSKARVLVDRLMAHIPKAHVAVAAAIADRVAERDGVPRERIRVIHSGIKMPGFSPREQGVETRTSLGIAAETRVLGWAGRMHPNKNVKLLLETASLLPDWHLLLIGDGDERDQVNHWIDELGLRARTTLTGEVERVPPLLACCDVFCLTSDVEGLPTVILEAMAVGVPVVARRVGGVPEVITHDLNGLLVDDADPRSMSAAVLATLHKPGLAINAIANIRANFDQNRMIDEFESVMREAASTKHPERA